MKMMLAILCFTLVVVTIVFALFLYVNSLEDRQPAPRETLQYIEDF